MSGHFDGPAGKRFLGVGFALFLGLVCFASSAQAQEDVTAKREKLFREGVDLYLQGRYSEAQKKLRDLLATEPRKELAARLVDEAGTKIMAKMMAEPRMGPEPTYIWQLYRKYYIGKLADKERMAKMAARVVDPAISDDERALLYREFAELGHYAVPVIAPYLNDKSREDFRTYARVVLARMGRVAVLPVIALLDHKDVLMRENAILTLSDIKPLDTRAIPALKARLEDEKETKTAKRLATRALELITGLPVDQLKAAGTYYYEGANRYYLERAHVAEEAREADGFIWHLNEKGELIPVLYPMWAWNEQMAEELVLKGVQLQVDQTDFYPLIACINGAQYMEVKDLLDVVSEDPVKHFFSEEEIQQVKAWDAKMVHCRTLAADCGRHYVNEALFKVLRDMKDYPGHAKLPNVGVFLCRILKDLDPEGELLELPPPPPPAPVAAPVVEEKPSPPVLTTITVHPPRAIVPPGGTQQYAAIARDQYGKKIEGIQFTWSVEEGGTIDETGLFTGGPVAGGPYAVYAQAANYEGAAVETKGAAKAEVEKMEPPKAAGDAPTQPAPAGAEPARIQGESDRMTFPHTSALVSSLDATDRALQYEAALALAHINRFPQPWKGQDRVAALLGRGVSENKPVQVLLVEEDHNIRNKMRTAIEGLGLGMTDAVTGRDALIKAKSFPPKDVIIISDKLRRDLTPEQLMEELQANVITRYTPVGILHNADDRNATKARFGTEIPLVERGMKGNDLKGAIEKLESLRPAMAAPKRKAHEIAVNCATALSKLDLRCTNMKLADAVPHCVAAMKNRKDDVRDPAARFLGKAKGGEIRDKAAEALLAVAQDGDNKTELRLTALKALGSVKPEAYADFAHKLQIADEPHELQYWAGVYFGRYLRTNKALRAVLQDRRIDREKKEK